MPTNVPSETLAALGAWALLGLAVAVAMGLGLLLWGRLLHRGLLVIVAAITGLVLGGTFSPQIGLDPILGRLGAAVALGLLGLVLARAVWAALAGAVVAAVTFAIVSVVVLHVPLPQVPPGTAQDVPARYKAATTQAVAEAMDRRNPLLLVATVGAGVAAVVGGFLLPRATVIVMTSLLGSSLLMAAGSFAAMTWLPSLLMGGSPRAPQILNGIAAGLLVLGIGFQTFAEFRSGRSAAAEDDEDDKPKKEKSGGKGKGK